MGKFELDFGRQIAKGLSYKNPVIGVLMGLVVLTIGYAAKGALYGIGIIYRKIRGKI